MTWDSKGGRSMNRRRALRCFVLGVAAVAMMASVALAAPRSATRTRRAGSVSRASGATRSYLAGPRTNTGAYFAPDGRAATPRNNTLSYRDWPDRARVSGQRPLLNREVVRIGSRDRGGLTQPHDDPE